MKSLANKAAIRVPDHLIGSTLHEYVLGLLFEQGRSSGLFPLPEYMPRATSKHRIDMIWLDGQCVITAGFEVDKTVYSKSVAKPLLLPNNALKVIISIGLGKIPLDKDKAVSKGIEVWEFTQNYFGMHEIT